jgi:RNA polymerase sigma factor (sigma-70 family)
VSFQGRQAGNFLRPAPLANILERLALDACDGAAWEDFYRTLWPFIIATMYRRLDGNRDSAEDASQDVMFRLAKYLKFGDLTPAGLYQYTKLVCTSVAMDRKRGKQFNMRSLEIPLDEMLSLADERPTPEEVAAIRKGVFEHLDSDERVLAERLADGHDPNDIAEVLNVSKANVYRKIAALRTRLRSIVGQPGS